MIETLDEIKGVGEKIKKDLISYYGSEKAATEALENQDFEGLLFAGLSVSRAMEIARYLASKRYGFSYSNILKTREAREIFNEIFESLRAYPRTDFGRIGIGVFHATLDRKEIERRQKYIGDCVKLAKGLSEKRDELTRNLLKIHSLREGEPHIDDLIAFEDKELYDEISRTFQRRGNFLLVETIEDLEYLRDFEFVRYVQKNSRFIEKASGLHNVEPVYEEDLEFIAPELVISFFSTNKECILSALRIAEISNDPELLRLAGDLFKEAGAIDSMGRNGVLSSSDKRLDTLSQALSDFDVVVEKHLNAANQAITEKIDAMTLKGGEVLEMLRAAPDSNLSLPKDFVKLISKEKEENEDLIAQRLGLNKGLFKGIFSTDTYLLEIDSQRNSELKQELHLEKRKLELNIKQNAAQNLSKHIKPVRNLVKRIMELDLRLALGEFAIDHMLSRPEIQDEIGLGFREGKHLFLKGKVQPVDYVIGSNSLFPGQKERAVVITGANSGGKTTLLELMAQIIIMTHMGFMVPAGSVSTSLFDGVYYFGKGQGTDAGAFESLLRTFAGLSKPSKRRIILADEIEAMTEPGAAAKIMVSLLEWFKDDENTLIAIVTHLGGDIENHITKGIRIDGIEASGLDMDLNLIVDRKPVLGKVAKSTPELIVEKLRKTSENKGFYEKIMDRFKG